MKNKLIITTIILTLAAIGIGWLYYNYNHTIVGYFDNDWTYKEVVCSRHQDPLELANRDNMVWLITSYKTKKVNGKDIPDVTNPEREYGFSTGEWKTNEFVISSTYIQIEDVKHQFETKILDWMSAPANFNKVIGGVIATICMAILFFILGYLIYIRKEQNAN